MNAVLHLKQEFFLFSVWMALPMVDVALLQDA
jgi:hypothetical protein